MSSTILIVEDEPLLRESLAGLLEGEGYQVIQAASGQEAYQVAIERPVDLVLSDIRRARAAEEFRARYRE